MPHGLGDNPLTKAKKRAAPRPGTSTAAQEAPSEHLSEAVSSISTPGSGSYNDVFFQRRSDNVTVVETAQPAPQAEPVAVAIAPIVLVAPVAEAVVVEQPAPAAVVPIQEAPAPVPQLAVQPAVQPPQEAQKPGLFSRIFGKLRK